MDKMIKTELYFGMSRYPHPDITDEQFDKFVDTYITARFPDGFTVVDGAGYWNAKGGTIRERCKIVIIVHPDDLYSHKSIEEIRISYCQQFKQESVLCVDSEIEVSF